MVTMPADCPTALGGRWTGIPKSDRTSELGGHPRLQTACFIREAEGPQMSHSVFCSETGGAGRDAGLHTPPPLLVAHVKANTELSLPP